MLKIGRSYSAVLLAFISFSPLLYAQNPTWPIDGPAFAASAGDIHAAAARIKPEPFTDATVLFEQEHYRLDAAGKDGTVRHVMSAMNPQGTYVHSFKTPSEEEAAHDFLWREHRVAPGRGAELA